jgi:hypothetical protein
MALGTFVAPQGNFIKSTPFNAAANEGHPLIVIVHDFKEDFSTEAYPNERPVAFVMIADLEPVKTGGKAILYANAILGGDAVADRLRKYAGTDEEGNYTKLPVKLGSAKSQKTSRNYRTIEPLEGAELKLATVWDEANPTALQDERARLQAEADAEAEAGGNAPKATSNGKGTDFDDDALAAAIAGLKG